MPFALVSKSIEDYCRAHSTPPSRALKALQRRTQKEARYPEMLVGHLEGAFLAALVRLIRAKRVLEVGTFTGYSALAMAEALPAAGRLVTLDLDCSTAQIAKKAWASTPHKKKIRQVLGHALNTLPGLRGPFDLCFIDADKVNYAAYFDLALARTRRGGLVVIDNTLWGGEALKPKSVSGRAIAMFNRRLKTDSRVDCLQLPLRDGVSLAFKR